MTSRHVTWIFIALLALAWGFLPPFTVTLLNYIGLYSMVAVGLVLLTGVGGMTSFGQAAFVGLGAYATAWVSGNPQVGEALAAIPPGLLPWLGLLLGLMNIVPYLGTTIGLAVALPLAFAGALAIGRRTEGLVRNLRPGFEGLAAARAAFGHHRGLHANSAWKPRRLGRRA